MRQPALACLCGHLSYQNPFPFSIHLSPPRLLPLGLPIPVNVPQYPVGSEDLESPGPKVCSLEVEQGPQLSWE